MYSHLPQPLDLRVNLLLIGARAGMSPDKQRRAMPPLPVEFLAHGQKEAVVLHRMDAAQNDYVKLLLNYRGSRRKWNSLIDDLDRGRE